MFLQAALTTAAKQCDAQAVVGIASTGYSDIIAAEIIIDYYV